MKKLLAVLLAVAMICALGVTAFADDAVAPKDGGSKLTFTTGGEAGTYYGFGSVLAQKVSDVTSTNVTAITSGGSAANIDAIDIGDAQIGFSQSDVLAYAYAGERTFEDLGEITSFSIVAPTSSSPVHPPLPSLPSQPARACTWSAWMTSTLTL